MTTCESASLKFLYEFNNHNKLDAVRLVKYADAMRACSNHAELTTELFSTASRETSMSSRSNQIEFLHDAYDNRFDILRCATKNLTWSTYMHYRMSRLLTTPTHRHVVKL